MREDAKTIRPFRLMGDSSLPSRLQMNYKNLFEIELVMLLNQLLLSLPSNVTWRDDSASVMPHKISFRACIYTKQTNKQDEEGSSG